ncbi:hypothetical protein GUITHDRAFT_101947 [Guillardia theta CCMP2712]|uniref:Uncharacterized protein n=1 Tax=Guillardia theta (strain CCMP2712) TaxID=905079 RepID=L1JVB5_GUITC|nr:hypothetical protein GUITHDRAFT_101947 [Guillardia theta CCMP2712]EKX52038.1 hypothetical protein GUITHDRAFT_101947 [Guillardia theta CCMP2712]|eukprot:XP_005839018.1 hypothetical protein GUITHDRAFT_101947 [Guillardia theta CCMP2712]
MFAEELSKIPSMMEKYYPTRAALEMKDPSVYTAATAIDDDDEREVVVSGGDRSEDNGDGDDDDADFDDRAAGVAYMYWRLATTTCPLVSQKQEYLDKSEAYISAALRMSKPPGKSLRTSTFLTGIAGVYAVAAAIAFTKKESTRVARLTKEVKIELS